MKIGDAGTRSREAFLSHLLRKWGLPHDTEVTQCSLIMHESGQFTQS